MMMPNPIKSRKTVTKMTTSGETGGLAPELRISTCYSRLSSVTGTTADGDILPHDERSRRGGRHVHERTVLRRRAPCAGVVFHQPERSGLRPRQSARDREGRVVRAVFT